MNASKSTETQRHKPTTIIDKAVPIKVRFFQSDLNLDEHVTRVAELTGIKL